MSTDGFKLISHVEGAWWDILAQQISIYVASQYFQDGWTGRVRDPGMSQNATMSISQKAKIILGASYKNGALDRPEHISECEIHIVKGLHTMVYPSRRAISNVPNIHLSPVQAFRMHDLHIAGEQIDRLIRPLYFFTVQVHIQDDPLDGLVAFQLDIISINSHPQSRIREDEIFPGLGPVRVSREDRVGLGVDQARLNDDGPGDLSG